MIGIFALAAVSAGALPADPCGAAAVVPSVKQRREISVDDLLKLRDMGASAAWAGSPGPFSVSPDRRLIAVQLTQASPAADDYCQVLMIVDVRTGAARRVDAWRGFWRQDYAHGGLHAGFENGVMQTVAPRWSPDGRAIAFFKLERGEPQLWRADLGRVVPVKLSAAPKLRDAAWVAPRRIVVSSVPALERARAEIEAEGRDGYLYDDRFFPMSSARPLPRAPVEVGLTTVDPESGLSEAASVADRDVFETAARSTMSGRVRVDGMLQAWLAQEKESIRLVASLGSRRFACTSRLCSDIVELGPRSLDDSVVFLRREGWAKAELGLYRWSLHGDRVDRIASTQDLLFGCDSGPRDWICARESATQPRHIVRVDTSTGKMSIVFDPNPGFPRLGPDRVRRVRVRSSAGAEAHADLVLPADFRPGQHYPTVVVQYESRGFLRGGTGDEYPIFPLAARGLVVLSFHRPADFASLQVPPPADRWDHHRINVSGWADRRQALSALTTILDQPEVQAVVDPARIGISGLSDGVGTVLFGLLGTNRFAAAAISSCCEEPVSSLTLMGTAFARNFRAAGYPGLTAASDDFWSPYSLKANAARLRTPLLMQLADNEYLFGLESYAALKEKGAPVEMYVFPNERHNKSGPRHRQAVYERNLRWFGFWLQDQKEGDIRFEAELQRWAAMRTVTKSGLTPGPAPTLPRRQEPAGAARPAPRVDEGHPAQRPSLRDR